MPLHRQDNETILLNRISKGDERAFGELFHAYYNHIGEFVQLFTHDLEATEEIVLEVFTKIWINRESLPLIENFDAYLFILCRNHTLNHVRKQAAEQKRHTAYLREVDNVAETLEEGSSDPYDLLEQAVQLLPPQQQKVFTLRRQGVKTPEISRRMSLSIESVKKYQHLAMKFIRDFVKAAAATSLFYWMVLFQ
ncbi:sigma-70 family RNA polymerase sigma factor [Parapedobacter defluvii]|uniref:sigma-70 family RNA polymerase sigma factor n=1 Tax=Parapedobacter defluvii TaxID=2045106 RepID=UPI0016692FAF|nr:sigma-70 family RNA polymerase sigma factor [Parapedobacter defluvii]